MAELPNEIGSKKRGITKFVVLLVLIIVGISAIALWWNYYYVFGEGVKSGQLNYVVLKGNLFKTYEGKLIQEGLRSRAGTIQSNEFEFSVTNDSIAKVLMYHSGNSFDLHYQEFKHPLPWRGFSPYIVDKIIAMRPPLK
ncbi:hypothetical protein SAMN05216436_10655 [bacterium A37T11]|nr:hypothetical protein SAMN05216436_10655 [bacterium A37T11]